MPKYNVYVYPIVRVLIKDVEANSQEEACRKAEPEATSWGMRNAEYADDIDGFLVDEHDDPEHERSTWYEKDYTPSPEGRR